MWTLPGVILGVAFMILCALAVLIGAALVISACSLYIGYRLSSRS